MDDLGTAVQNCTGYTGEEVRLHNDVHVQYVDFSSAWQQACGLPSWTGVKRSGCHPVPNQPAPAARLSPVCWQPGRPSGAPSDTRAAHTMTVRVARDVLCRTDPAGTPDMGCITMLDTVLASPVETFADTIYLAGDFGSVDG